jgi:O-methyltransferase
VTARNSPEFRQTISSQVRLAPEPRTPEEFYLDLIKRVLTRTLSAREMERHALRPTGSVRRRIHGLLQSLLSPLGLELVRVRPCDANDYLESGHAAFNRVEDAETMVGTRQLDNMQACVTTVVRENIPGDLLEAGVWRGGMTILMKALLTALGDKRNVWVVDSFEGLPDPERSQDSFGWAAGEMAVSLAEVKGNFARYGLLDDRVRFLKGFFSDTLPTAPIERLSILRVDADLYESTKDVLDNLYSKLSPGGFAIFDDYQNLKDCRRAVDECRARHDVRDPIVNIDSRAVFWRKSKA